MSMEGIIDDNMCKKNGAVNAMMLARYGDAPSAWSLCECLFPAMCKTGCGV